MSGGWMSDPFSSPKSRAARAAYKHAERAMGAARDVRSTDLRNQSIHAMGVTRTAMTDPSKHPDAASAHMSAHKAHSENKSPEAAGHHQLAAEAHTRAHEAAGQQATNYR